MRIENGAEFLRLTVDFCHHSGIVVSGTIDMMVYVNEKVHYHIDVTETHNDAND